MVAASAFYFGGRIILGMDGSFHNPSKIAQSQVSGNSANPLPPANDFVILFPMPKSETQLPAYEEMIKAGMHFGRKKTVFHPNMEPYIYTLKENIHILDLLKTGAALLQAIAFLKPALAEGKLILLVGLTKQSAEPIKQTAEALGLPYVTERWLGGTMTNFKTINARVKYLEDLEKKQAADNFAGYTKKEELLKSLGIVLDSEKGGK